MVALLVGTDPGREEQRAIGAESEAAGEGNDSLRQNALFGAVEHRRESHDGARAARSDMVAPVGSEDAAAGVQMRDWAGIAHDSAVSI